MSYFYKRVLSAFMALALIGSALGCQAQDQHVFQSTVLQPLTIELIDTYRGEAVWSMDIPVNHKLTLQFDGNPRGAIGDAGGSPSWVKWKLYRADDLPINTGKKRLGKLISSDKVDLTGKRVRMMVSYRESPELPSTVDGMSAPVATTTESLAREAITESRQPPAMAQPSPDTQADDEASLTDPPQAVEEEAEPVEIHEETQTDEQVEPVLETEDTAATPTQ